MNAHDFSCLMQNGPRLLWQRKSRFDRPLTFPQGKDQCSASRKNLLSNVRSAATHVNDLSIRFVSTEAKMIARIGVPEISWPGLTVLLCALNGLLLKQTGARLCWVWVDSSCLVRFFVNIACVAGSQDPQTSCSRRRNRTKTFRSESVQLSERRSWLYDSPESACLRLSY